MLSTLDATSFDVIIHHYWVLQQIIFIKAYQIGYKTNTYTEKTGELRLLNYKSKCL